MIAVAIIDSNKKAPFGAFCFKERARQSRGVVGIQAPHSTGRKPG